ncbi:hypothetical protein POM88_042960 [Heracleum sosnowskyi]|uniref:Uncharacterized protein n=1 Tax=Heracleum sosnowskyi TaxID=360622 RepID=A0AAD8MC45_9APIA|nr:hypothetical protein POM88_042960 [Heracleum sosnowskyi]
MQKSTNKNDSGDFWSKSDVSYDQLQKFWNGLSRHGRQDILKVDRQTLLEQARKNMVCSKCYGFLAEELSEFIIYRTSPRPDGAVNLDPCIDPWDGLTITKDGTQSLTLDGCFLSTSLKEIQQVFDNARTRERERKLLFPHSCGAGGRRCKRPGSKESCAVLTAPLPLEKLVTFWSSEEEESRQKLFKMKEEDFIERLTFRFVDKKLCKYCRKNVVREFRELKELTGTQKESGFQYEISHDTVQADWSQTFIHTYGSYSHFEWGIGTVKGKFDISGIKNVGLSTIVQVKGLDISGLDACYITLRAWKTDGDCTELSVKARTSMGQQYVHCSLAVGDGFVTVTEGESITDFFKHAEELLKEDDKFMDVNGNRLDEACSHPQKDAKSPELARKFLLDAATIFFKEQVGKALREKRVSQNGHNIFVSLALNMLEERVHVSCKELLILENQEKLLEEEEKEKNEEEERKERRRNKEREKKLRRKERTKEKEKNGDTSSLTEQHVAPQINIEESIIVDEAPDATETVKITSSGPVSPHFQDEQEINDYMRNNMHNSSDACPDENFDSNNSKNGSSGSDLLKYSGLKLKNRYRKDATSKCPDRNRYRTDATSKCSDRNVPSSRDSPQSKEVGETMGLQKKDVQSHSESDVAVRSSTLSGDAMEPYKPINLISQAEEKGFSLFHFGSPFALADASKSDSLPSKDYVGGPSLVKFIHHDEGDLTSNNGDSFEEYNLFSTTKGITFSLFSK